MYFCTCIESYIYIILTPIFRSYGIFHNNLISRWLLLVFNNQTNKSYSYKKYVCRNELIAKEIPITWIYADRHKQSIFLNNP